MGMASEEVCELSAYQDLQDRFIFLEGQNREAFKCGEWWVRGGPTEQLKGDPLFGEKDWALLTHGFVWHKDVFDIAAHVVNFLGIFEYNALHARYNDFQYQSERQDPSLIWDRWESVFKSAPKLYVASDDPERIMTLRQMAGIEVYTFDDMLNT